MSVIVGYTLFLAGMVVVLFPQLVTNHLAHWLSQEEDLDGR